MNPHFAPNTTLLRPGQTKLYYHIDEEEHPFVCNLNIPMEQVTLADLKKIIPSPNNYRYFMKSHDAEFGGVVKKALERDTDRLEAHKGRIVVCLQSMVVENIRGSDPGSQHDSDSNRSSKALLPPRRSFDAPLRNARDFSNKERNHRSLLNGRGTTPNYSNNNGRQSETNGGFETDSMVSFDYHTPSQKNSYSDSEYDGSSRASTMADDQESLPRNDRFRRKKLTKQRSNLVRASSASSVTDTVCSVNQSTMFVRLNREHGGTLGIKPVAQNGEVYVDSVLKGCLVDLDNRIHAGDIIVEANHHRLSGISSEEATNLLRELTKKPGPICLKIIKADPNLQHHHQQQQQQYSPRRSEISDLDSASSYYPPTYYPPPPEPTPVSSIDHMGHMDHMFAWIANTEAMKSSSSVAPTSLYSENLQLPGYGLSDVAPQEILTVATDMATVIRRMAARDSGLEVKNRMWLKIEIKDAFMGRNLVKWIKDNIQGMNNAKDAKKYAAQLLQSRYILQTMGTIEFSEKAYYIFNKNMQDDHPSSLPLINHEDIDDLPDSVSQVAGPNLHHHYQGGLGYPSLSGLGSKSRRANGSGHSSGGSGTSFERHRSTIYEETASQQLRYMEVPPSSMLQGLSMTNTQQDTVSRNSFKMAMGKY